MTPQALSALKEQREQLWSTIDAVLEENAKLRSEVDSLRSAPVALMVPGMDDNAELLPILEEAGKDLDCGRIALNAWIVKHANPTPSSRLLKDGEVVEPWNEDSCRKILSLINQRDEAVRLAESLRIDAAANLLRDVPPSRILKDGEVAIRADVLSAMEGCIATLRADDELIPSKALAHLDALRSKGGE